MEERISELEHEVGNLRVCNATLEQSAVLLETLIYLRAVVW